MPRSKRLLVAAAVLAHCAAAAAQHSHAYAFAGVSGVPSSAFTYWHGAYLHAGAGGEGGIGRRFALGGEVGALIATAERYTRNAAVLSAGPSFHFLPRGERKLDPFVAGGFSLLAGRGVGGMAYFGGGLNYWFHPRIGLRAEFRDHAWTPESGSTIQFVGARFGVCFR